MNITHTNTDIQPASDDTGRPRRSANKAASVVVSLALLAVALVAFGVTSRTEAKSVDEYELTVDVAEDGTRFIFDEAPVHDDGWPDGGNAFVTEGYIYEAGAIAAGAGVNPDGTPTHPELVIGSWYCEGHMLGEGAYAESGPWVISKQVFDFETDTPAGSTTIVSDGLELVDHEVEGVRAVVGGTGQYRAAFGQQAQVLHGHNDSEGVQLTVELDFQVPHQK